MSDEPQMDIEKIISGGGRILKILSIILILLGLGAIVFPHVASLSIEFFVGGVLLIGGIIQIVHALQARAHGGFLWSVAIGLLQVSIGLVLLVYPLSGIVALTVFLAISLTLEGFFRSRFAVQIRPKKGWAWALFSGLLSVFVGVMLYMQLPGSALWAVGLLIGINLTMAGWSLLMLSMAGSAVAKALEN